MSSHLLLVQLAAQFLLGGALSGLGRTTEERLRPRADGREPLYVRLLTPLLRVFVLLDLLSFWSAAWVARDALEFSSLTLLSILLFASSYYLAGLLGVPNQSF